jgi:hypothetical protein
VNYVIDVWNTFYITYGNYLSEKRKPNFDGSIFEIKILHILAGLIVYVLALVIDTTFASVICVVKLIPAIFKSWKEVTNLWKTTECAREVCLCVYILIMICIPVVSCIGVAVVIIYSFVTAINVIFVMFRTDSVTNGFRKIFINIYNIDLATNPYISKTLTTSFFPCFNFQLENVNVSQTFDNSLVREGITNEMYPNDAPRTHIIHSVVTSHQARDQTQNITNSRIDIGNIWNNFFEMCSYQCEDMIAAGVCLISEVIGQESYLFIGLPGLVVFRAITRSLNIPGIMLSDGVIITKDSVPSDEFSTSLFNDIISIKHQIKTQNFSENELDFIGKWIFTMGNVDKCVEPTGISNGRMSSIKLVISMIQRIGINISMIPSCHRRFGNALDVVIKNYNSRNNTSIV